jgi:hypothetical protein
MRVLSLLTVFYPVGDQVALNRSNVFALVFSSRSPLLADKLSRAFF